MAYCRFSSLGGFCDVYAYACADAPGTVAVHVAYNRRVRPDDMPPDPLDLLLAGHLSPEAFAEAYQDYNERLQMIQFDPTGLSRDGQDFVLEYAAAADLIASLRAEGYNVPVGVEAVILADMGGKP